LISKCPPKKLEKKLRKEEKVKKVFSSERLRHSDPEYYEKVR
jgi:hypothetical protein